MKIALIGYGKMGKTIERIALSRGHEIVARLRSDAGSKEWESVQATDVSIEFTRPDAAIHNLTYCLENNLAVVTGTTGWYDQMEDMKTLCAKKHGSFFWASNFSIGVNLFWQINKRLAQIMSQHTEYKVSMDEIHHTQKLDEPSGTAITTANQIISEHPLLNAWKLNTEATGENDLAIRAIREGDVKGTHIVNYESDIDRIQIMHEAKSRDGFALGAVLAAEFLHGRKGFFTMEDMLKINP